MHGHPLRLGVPEKLVDGPPLSEQLVLETLLIVANVATAVVAYPVLKRESELGAIGYVSARLVEGMFIAIGIVSALAFLLMRQDATAVAIPALGDAFDSLYYRAFLLGPGFFAGLANGVILGYLMYRSELVPRGMTWLGLIGPLVMITGIAVMFDVIERQSGVQVIATIPEFFWELSLSIYCIVKGFRLSSPILRTDTVTTLPESDSALRQGALDSPSQDRVGGGMRLGAVARSRREGRPAAAVARAYVRDA